jgi:hypothetical protein
LVLQNLSHTFSKPNILDIKLGTILWDEYATPEKRARMEKAARDTTSLETGVRLTGFNVSLSGPSVHIVSNRVDRSMTTRNARPSILQKFTARPSKQRTYPTALPNFSH